MLKHFFFLVLQPKIQQRTFSQKDYFFSFFQCILVHKQDYPCLVYFFGLLTHFGFLGSSLVGEQETSISFERNAVLFQALLSVWWCAPIFFLHSFLISLKEFSIVLLTFSRTKRKKSGAVQHCTTIAQHGMPAVSECSNGIKLSLHCRITY